MTKKHVREMTDAEYAAALAEIERTGRIPGTPTKPASSGASSSKIAMDMSLEEYRAALWTIETSGHPPVAKEK
jgi:hypothetical protein